MNENLATFYHFAISLVVLVGGGYMAYQGKADGLAPAAIGAVIVFWFQGSMNRSVSSIISNLTAQQPAPPVVTPGEQPK